MTRSTVSRRFLHLAVGGGVAFVLLLCGIAGLVMKGELQADDVRAQLASRARAPRTEADRARILDLARATRAPRDTGAAGAAAESSPLPPSPDEAGDSDPGERPIHAWLTEMRLTRAQPGPAPSHEALRALGRITPALDALAGELARHDDEAPFAALGDWATRSELEHARTLLVTAACAEWLSGEGDPARGERLLDAAWRLHRALPPAIDDGGPGDLFLAALRQARVADARGWAARIDALEPRARLAAALQWDAAARLSWWDRRREERRQVKPGWIPSSIQRFLGEVASKHDLVFTSRIAGAETTLAEEALALQPCDDPWRLQDFAEGAMRRHRPVAAETRLRTALASASLARADAALTRHVLLRRHGFAIPEDPCGASLVERRAGENALVVGWPVAGRDEPGPAPLDRPRNHSAGFRTWPEPSLPGPPLDPFRFEIPPQAAPVLTTAPAP